MGTTTTALEAIKSRANRASEGPWGAARGATSDNTEFVSTYEQKAGFLALSLNDEESHLWLVDNGTVIPAATGDGPKAEANAEFIAHSRTDVPKLVAALEAVEAFHVPTWQSNYRGGREMCRHDTHDWPCPTVRAIEEALQ